MGRWTGSAWCTLYSMYAHVHAHVQPHPGVAERSLTTTESRCTHGCMHEGCMHTPKGPPGLACTQVPTVGTVMLAGPGCDLCLYTTTIYYMHVAERRLTCSCQQAQSARIKTIAALPPLAMIHSTRAGGCTRTRVFARWSSSSCCSEPHHPLFSTGCTSVACHWTAFLHPHQYCGGCVVPSVQRWDHSIERHI